MNAKELIEKIKELSILSTGSINSDGEYVEYCKEDFEYILSNEDLKELEQYADHKTKELQKEVERLREKKEELKDNYKRLEDGLIDELQQLKQENKELVDEILRVWNEDNGSVQPHTPIAWYRVIRIVERLTKTNKDER